MLIYRYQNRADAVSNRELRSIELVLNESGYPGVLLIEKGGIYYDDGDEKTLVAHIVSINNFNKIKSQDFSRVDYLFMDEFETEDGRYIPKEPEKLLNIIDTVARGFNQPYRPIQCVLASNNVDPINDYFKYFKLLNEVDAQAQS